MSLMIAVAGKGGVGKTTCSALLLRALLALAMTLTVFRTWWSIIMG